MLILTRNIGETIHIGDDVRVTVLGVDQSQVKIGIDAPRTTPVHRQEIYYRINAENDTHSGVVLDCEKKDAYGNR